jgi:hypothetical protein
VERLPRKWVLYGLGALLLIFNAYFGTYAYVVVQALLWGQTALQRGPVNLLFFLVIVNIVILRIAKKHALSQQELAILYAMICIGTCSSGYGFTQILINHMPAPFYESYATGGSKFKDYIWPNVPTWLVPQDKVALNNFFRGNSSLYDPNNWHAWVIPILTWSAFIVAIFWTLLCATTLVRKQWVEEERLTFPLVLLPLEMTERGGNNPFWRNKWMWIGFIVAGLLESTNFLNFLYPALPSLPIKARAGSNEISLLLTTRPWNTMGMITLSFYPCIIGIGYLISLDVSFSCWSLYLGGKLLTALCAAAGLTDGGSGPTNRLPYLREQGLGAFVGIALFSAWASRRALREAWREMEKPTGKDKGELMSFRMAILGGGVGLFFLVFFLFVMGLTLWQSILYVFVYLCIALTLARIVSEAGAGWAWAPSWSAGQFSVEAIGATQLSPKNIVMGIAYTGWMSDMRDNPMPHTTEASKFGQGANFPSLRPYLGPLVFAIVFSTILGFWSHLDAYYTYGAATAKVRPALQSGATGAARQAVSMIVSPTVQDVPGLSAAGVGMLIAVGLSAARQLFTGFPIHPLGYALSATNSMEYMWCPFLIAWGIKSLLVKYGGIRAYRAALPFFLGLILGDYVVPMLWGVFGMLTGSQQYMVFPH